MRIWIFFSFLFFLVIQQSNGRGLTHREKVERLNELSSRTGVIKFNKERWVSLVRSKPRNYSVFVIFTSKKFCPKCYLYVQEFSIVANSWRLQSKEQEKKKIFFGVVEHEDSSDVFEMMRLTNVPMIFHFDPHLRLKQKPTLLEFGKFSYDANTIAKFVEMETDVKINIYRPPDYTNALKALLVIIVISGILYIYPKWIRSIFTTTKIAICCLTFSFLFMSGIMWTHIRKPELMNGRTNSMDSSKFISKHYRYQYEVETYIIALLYAFITGGMILVNKAADGKNLRIRRYKYLPRKTETLAVAGIALVVIGFSVLLKILETKYHGYPYSYLL